LRQKVKSKREKESGGTEGIWGNERKLLIKARRYKEENGKTRADTVGRIKKGRGKRPGNGAIFLKGREIKKKIRKKKGIIGCAEGREWGTPLIKRRRASHIVSDERGSRDATSGSGSLKTERKKKEDQGFQSVGKN